MAQIEALTNIAIGTELVLSQTQDCILSLCVGFAPNYSTGLTAGEPVYTPFNQYGSLSVSIKDQYGTYIQQAQTGALVYGNAYGSFAVGQVPTVMGSAGFQYVQSVSCLVPANQTVIVSTMGAALIQVQAGQIAFL